MHFLKNQYSEKIWVLKNQCRTLDSPGPGSEAPPPVVGIYVFEKVPGRSLEGSRGSLEGSGEENASKLVIINWVY